MLQFRVTLGRQKDEAQKPDDLAWLVVSFVDCHLDQCMVSGQLEFLEEKVAHEKMLRRVLLFAICLTLALECSGQRRSRRQTHPGKLLLNMLIKDEAGHLDRSLPKWAPLIDYWIVGIGL